MTDSSAHFPLNSFPKWKDSSGTGVEFLILRSLLSKQTHLHPVRGIAETLWNGSWRQKRFAVAGREPEIRPWIEHGAFAAAWGLAAKLVSPGRWRCWQSHPHALRTVGLFSFGIRVPSAGTRSSPSRDEVCSVDGSRSRLMFDVTFLPLVSEYNSVSCYPDLLMAKWFAVISLGTCFKKFLFHHSASQA